MDANRLICALEAHVRATRGGWDDRRSLARFNRLALDLMATLESPRGREALGAACTWAEILYSTLRHQPRQRSLAQVHQAVLSDLERVRRSLDKRAVEMVITGSSDARYPKVAAQVAARPPAAAAPEVRPSRADRPRPR